MLPCSCELTRPRLQIATAFIHLLSPGLSELTSPCLGAAWQVYPYALALAMLSIFSIFIIEIIAFRVGTAKLKKIGAGHGSFLFALISHNIYKSTPVQTHMDMV